MCGPFVKHENIFKNYFLHNLPLRLVSTVLIQGLLEGNRGIVVNSVFVCSSIHFPFLLMQTWFLMCSKPPPNIWSWPSNTEMGLRGLTSNSFSFLVFGLEMGRDHCVVWHYLTFQATELHLNDYLRNSLTLYNNSYALLLVLTENTNLIRHTINIAEISLVKLSYTCPPQNLNTILSIHTL